jgi:hypothetical protein
MIVAHLMGLPIEETASQLAPAGAATLTVIAVVGRTWLGRLKRRLRSPFARGTRNAVR